MMNEAESMRDPRQRLPGESYVIQRRCVQLLYLLVPDSTYIAEVFGYCLAYAAQKHGILVHGYCVLPFEWLVAITDPNAAAPEFTRDVHRMVAQCLNLHLNRIGYFWNANQPAYVPLNQGRDDFMRHLVEVFCAAVALGFVRHQKDWPGLKSSPEDYGKTKVFERPEFFRDKGNMPATMELSLVRPDGWEERSDEEFVDLLKDEIKVEEKTHRQRMKAAGERFAGAKRMRRRGRDRQADCMSRLNRRSGHRPVRNRWLERERRRRSKSFVKDYRAAYVQWKSGDHSAIFPAGTYQLSRYECVNVAPQRAVG